jgi:hypothetical protein
MRLFILILPLIFPAIIIVGVNESLQSGVTSELHAKIEKGSGQILLPITNTLIGQEFQREARTAVKAASTLLGINPNEYDVKFDFSVNGTSIDGPSAGAAMALAVILAYKHIDLNNDYCITGAVSEDGEIIPVGAVNLKAQVCLANGYKYFFVPYGEGKDVKIREIQVFEVKDLNELFSKIIAIEDKNITLKPPPKFVPENCKVKLTHQENFKKEYEKLEHEYLTVLNQLKSGIKTKFYSIIETKIKIAEYYYKKSKEYFDKGYIYPALNELFHGLYELEVAKNLYENPSLTNPNSLVSQKYKEKLQELFKKWDKEVKELHKYTENTDYLIAGKLRWSWAKSRNEKFSIEGYILANLWYKVFKLFISLSGKEAPIKYDDKNIYENSKIEYENYLALVGKNSIYEKSAAICEQKKYYLCAAMNYVYATSEIYPESVILNEETMNKILNYQPKTEYGKLMYTAAYLYASEAKFYWKEYPDLAKSYLKESLSYYYISKKFDEIFATKAKKESALEIILEFINELIKLIDEFITKLMNL